MIWFLITCGIRVLFVSVECDMPRYALVTRMCEPLLVDNDCTRVSTSVRVVLTCVDCPLSSVVVAFNVHPVPCRLTGSIFSGFISSHATIWCSAEESRAQLFKRISFGSLSVGALNAKPLPRKMQTTCCKLKYVIVVSKVG